MGRVNSPLYNTPEKIIARVQRGPDECWIWDGWCDPRTGYGQVGLDGRTWAFHRLMYTIFKGDIPKGMKVLHACDRPPCGNPAHLRLGSQQDNLEDMRQKGRHWRAKANTCRRGHEYTPENTRYYPSAPTRRNCLTCSKLRGKLPRINFPDRYPRNKALRALRRSEHTSPMKSNSRNDP